MKNKYSGIITKGIGAGLTCLAMSVMLPAVAQNQAPICGNELPKMEKEHPGITQAQMQFMQEFAQWKQTVDMSQFETSEAGNRIIPVVVHVLHKGGNENISKAQIQSQLVATNKDLQALNDGLVNLASFPAFDTLVADMDMEFRLATLDPQGNCTDGIMRIYTDKTDEAKDFTEFKKVSAWDRSKYFNLWVVTSIFDDGEPGQILGYAQFPYTFNNTPPLTSTDGVAVIHSSFGTMGTAANGTGATLTHEIGHWLGLRHIWGDSECGDDEVDDTPIHREPNYCNLGCPFPLPKVADCIDPELFSGQDSIDAVYRRDSVGEMWMNFMDYTDDEYLWMFTWGQKAVMDFVFTQYSFRASTITEANNIATGTDDAAQTSPCTTQSPIADLWSRTGSNTTFDTKMLCEGDSLNFTDGTFNGVPTSRQWTFGGGTPGTSTVTNPVVVYPTQGLYDVSLTATNTNGSSSKTREDYVKVFPSSPDASSFAYYEPFEYNSLYEQGKWFIANDGKPENKWEHFGGAGYMSSKSMRMLNEFSIRFEQDALVSASYDFTAMANEELYFKYAYAKKTGSPFVDQPDQLQVLVSTNCGKTWVARPIKVENTSAIALTGSRLVTGGISPSGYVPSGPNDWKEASVDLATATNSPNVRIMFLWTSGGSLGNNFFLDDINISNSNSVGIPDQTLGQTGFKVYPNPVSSISQVYFNLVESGRVSIDLLDITGRIVGNVYNGELNAGEQYFEVSNSDFNAAGVYFVRLNVNGVISTQKIIVE